MLLILPSLTFNSQSNNDHNDERSFYMRVRLGNFSKYKTLSIHKFSLSFDSQYEFHAGTIKHELHIMRHKN